MHGFIDGADCVYAVSTKVMRGVLQMFLCVPERIHRRPDLGMPGLSN